ncbi:D-alanyl-D-alanine carboxypeptidase/D-alanyl-D-alanine-endopeptidase (penicillin-binding protein 4) [Nocardiopsis mwathae]|uniref:D-alanyl-D-alanine carboxypeptidase/D-alanyl-D-alanine-endopeptidase (Penicillin-binding protein 4) n=1 Tax=Nocardiopsis mwathae TaxID=1472723 RepID=A0A7X0D7Z0_9ACTN|nr:D-alanyl-D-alanine carboxypeptidase/D-alanyl-D-alanine-endopeptidase [Nocardiopsis mwathae]MBB6174993.1 D-alanyl-D-alanine carboxypeptidase/D-alanyl-D-alanine-endopeptidase (penicillin-binding protein 4) [Nocardiopsis mwathae]
MLNIFVLVAGVVAVDVLKSRPSATMPYPVALAEEAPASAGSDADPISPDRLADKLDDRMSDSDLSDGLSAFVTDAATGTVLFQKDAGEARIPASTTKIVTAITALDVLGPDAHLRTTAVRDGGTVILVGAGDPMLTERNAPDDYPQMASLEELADRTAEALRGDGVDSVRLAYDDSLYTGPAEGPDWKPSYIWDGNVAKVTALMVDGGRTKKQVNYSERVDDPPRAAADAFARRLRDAGVRVEGRPSPAEAPADAEELAAVGSASISALVERMMLDSDNNIAEALFRQVALAKGEEVSFSGASRAVGRVMADFGVSGVHVEDGSGLTRNNRISPKALVELLEIAADPQHPELRATITGLPTAHFSGSLHDRYSADSGSAAGAGLVRGKTGTLNGVSALAGTVHARDGRLVLYAFVANDEAAAGRTLDTFTSAIAECGCT